MKQPKIKIFDGVYDVVGISFEKGEITQITYQNEKGQPNIVFKGDTVLKASLTGTIKIQQPTKHPHFDYAFAPDLEKLLC